MLCENCGKNEANVKYTQIINGEKKETILCQECSNILGINNITFDIPITFSSMLGGLFEDIEKSKLFPEINPIKKLKCKNCNLTFEEFMQSGKFGCAECYNTFEEKVDEILKKIQGNNRHIGRLSNVEDIDKKEIENKQNHKEENKERKDEKISQVERLKKDLKEAIKEERYEDAAKIRDEIKKSEESNI